MNKHGKEGRGGHEHHMMCKSSGLTEENTKFCHEAMMSAFKKDKALFEQMHALHEKMHAVMTTEQFDKKQFLAISSQMEQLRSKMTRHHAEAFASVAEKLTPEERENMMKMFHGHDGRDRKEHGDYKGSHDSYGHLNN
jgi:Spy/CpxP family protein refolding chaperone